MRDMENYGLMLDFNELYITLPMINATTNAPRPIARFTHIGSDDVLNSVNPKNNNPTIARSPNSKPRLLFTALLIIRSIAYYVLSYGSNDQSNHVTKFGDFNIYVADIILNHEMPKM